MATPRVTSTTLNYGRLSDRQYRARVKSTKEKLQAAIASNAPEGRIRSIKGELSFLARNQRSTTTKAPIGPIARIR